MHIVAVEPFQSEVRLGIVVILNESKIFFNDKFHLSIEKSKRAQKEEKKQKENNQKRDLHESRELFEQSFDVILTDCFR